MQSTVYSATVPTGAYGTGQYGENIANRYSKQPQRNMPMPIASISTVSERTGIAACIMSSTNTTAVEPVSCASLLQHALVRQV